MINDVAIDLLATPALSLKLYLLFRKEKFIMHIFFYIINCMFEYTYIIWYYLKQNQFTNKTTI